MNSIQEKKMETFFFFFYFFLLGCNDCTAHCQDILTAFSTTASCSPWNATVKSCCNLFKTVCAFTMLTFDDLIFKHTVKIAYIILGLLFGCSELYLWFVQQLLIGKKSSASCHGTCAFDLLTLGFNPELTLVWIIITCLTWFICILG